MVIIDNAIRWNSTYIMIYCALKLYVQIMMFYMININDIKDDALS
jgi:hypothetical protein